LLVAGKALPITMRWLMSFPPRPAPRPQREYLVVSLLPENPTSAAHDSISAPGVTTRARSRRIAAASAGLPDEILVWEIFVRLGAKDIIRCGAVCRSWRSLTSTADFLLGHHRRQPSRLLLTLTDSSSTESILPILERSQPVLGFDDHGVFTLHASCDGLLLLSLYDGSFYICNPATRQCAPVPGLTDEDIHIKAMYMHHPSGEYRVLYRNTSYTDLHLDVAYYIFTVPLGSSSRCIGVTSASPDMKKVMIEWHEWRPDDLAPPIVLNNCLHWDPDWIQNDAGIVVFNTLVESFRFMRRPAVATSFCLCDIEGLMGFSCFDNGYTIAKIWVLEDYEREVWAFKYEVKFPVEICSDNYSLHLALTQEGYMLAYGDYELFIFHCDNTGNLLEEFRWETTDSTMIGHWFKESLVKPDFFPKRGCTHAGQPNLFHSL
jgi:F-box interacting protein